MLDPDVVDAAAARLAARFTPAADVWQQCINTVALLRADYDDGSWEWQILGRALRALYGLDPDGTWRTAVDDQTRQVVTARQAAHVHELDGPMLAVVDQLRAERYRPAPAERRAA